jgi:twitching motility protein PilT
VAGELVISDYPALSAENARLYADEPMTDGARVKLDAGGDVDSAFGRSSVGRFRVNVYRQRGSTNIAVRAIGSGTFSFEELGMPHAMDDICRSSEGLVMVTGGAGAGKTTTLAAMIDHINRNRRVSILTIEDPIEVLHSDKMGLVSQREVGLDTPSFGDGLHKASRQDPDVVYVSEVRDYETLDAAFQVARTGHLVLTSMGTSDAKETVDRIISMYPSEDIARVRKNLSAGLRAVVSLRLMTRIDEGGRIPAAEVLINTERAIAALAGAEGALDIRTASSTAPTLACKPLTRPCSSSNKRASSVIKMRWPVQPIRLSSNSPSRPWVFARPRSEPPVREGEVTLARLTVRLRVVFAHAFVHLPRLRRRLHAS